jgi:hypothetical protein
MPTPEVATVSSDHAIGAFVPWHLRWELVPLIGFGDHQAGTGW